MDKIFVVAMVILLVLNTKLTLSTNEATNTITIELIAKGEK